MAKVGEMVYMDGGEVGNSLRNPGAVDERTMRETHERCPGPCWLVGFEVTLTPPMPVDDL